MVTIAMDRHTWSDERIDDMVGRLDKNMDALRGDLQAGFTRLDERLDRVLDRMDHGFAATQRQLLYAVLMITTMMVATLATLLASSL